MGAYWDKEFETMAWGDLHNYWLDKFNALTALKSGLRGRRTRRPYQI